MCLPVGEGEREWGEQSHCELLPITHLYSGEAAAGDCGLPGPVGVGPSSCWPDQVSHSSPDIGFLSL